MQSLLLIDDDPMSRELLEVVLSAEGYAVTAANSGEQAVSLLASRQPQIILADLQMPGLCGPRLATAIRALVPPDLILLAMSATAPETPLPGYNGFLLKPFTLERLAAAITGSSLAHSLPGQPQTLDESTYAKLAATMPVAQLSQLFNFALDDATARVTRMRTHIEVEDNIAYRKEAHAIKGSCSMLGATSLASIADSMERDGIYPITSTLSLDEFMFSLSHLRSMLNFRLSNTGCSPSHPAQLQKDGI